MRPGTAHAFHEVVSDQVVPMLKSRGMDVVAYGVSNHEEETYFLVRSYTDREALDQEQSVFYQSSEWRKGPRAQLIDKIETYLNTLLWCSEAGVLEMRNLNSPRA